MKRYSFWFFFILLTFIITLPVSWWGLAKVDFFYGAIYDSISIDEHIEKYAPRNQMGKQGFETTSKEEVVELFHEVVNAIHNKGDGLESLTYNSTVSDGIDAKTTLFTEAEVTHLKDVANLLLNIKPVILIAIALWLVCLLWLIFKRVKLPSLIELTSLAFLWVLALIFILLLGPEKVFNQLHIWAFPVENQWFFYYEESLMSTMMKAPLLFAVIAGIWGLVSVLLTLLLFRLMHPLLLFRRKAYYE